MTSFIGLSGKGKTVEMVGKQWLPGVGVGFDYQGAQVILEEGDRTVLDLDLWE